MQADIIKTKIMKENGMYTIMRQECTDWYHILVNKKPVYTKSYGEAVRLLEKYSKKEIL